MNTAENKEKELAAAALELLQDYTTDEELTAFTALDTMEFYS